MSACVTYRYSSQYFETCPRTRCQSERTQHESATRLESRFPECSHALPDSGARRDGGLTGLRLLTRGLGAGQWAQPTEGGAAGGRHGAHGRRECRRLCGEAPGSSGGSPAAAEAHRCCRCGASGRPHEVADAARGGSTRRLQHAARVGNLGRATVALPHPSPAPPQVVGDRVDHLAWPAT